jgi:arabinogalactan endo-1,4-beta-galactosidase
MKTIIGLSLGLEIILIMASCQEQPEFYYGADLSYVNEMLDCGGTYRLNGQVTDPYQIFAEKGCNLVRVRLWNNPNWTEYSNSDDVFETIRKAKENHMQVLLDIHYSDTWADPSHQVIPATWKGIADLNILCDSVYQFTFNYLMRLEHAGIMPEMVQVGNEINIEVMQNRDTSDTKNIDWKRNVALLNSGIKAVRDAGEQAKSIKPLVMLHIAQPDHAYEWFDSARVNGIAPYDFIGLSYYSNWSDFSMQQLSDEVARLKKDFGKEVMVVETSYPWTLESFDPAHNILGEQSLDSGFRATPQGQLQYMITLTQKVIDGGGIGVIYWEPAWISTSCSTLWGQGSHWENATFFDAGHQNEALPVFQYMKHPYTK